MAFTFTWAWYNTSGAAWADFTAGNLIGFYGSNTYGTKVQVASYNAGMHLRTSSGVDTDACPANHMTGLQYVTSGTVNIKGVGPVNLNTVSTLQSVRITFTDGVTLVSTENTLFWSYDGSTDATPPVGVNVYGAEQSNSSWTSCGGSAAAVTIANQTTPAITHLFYVLMTASPTSVGEKTQFAWKISVDYY